MWDLFQACKVGSTIEYSLICYINKSKKKCTIMFIDAKKNLQQIWLIYKNKTKHWRKQ